MPPFDASLPALQFPLLGNSLAVGIPSLLHIALAGLSVGFMILAPLFEWKGRSNPYLIDLAHSVTRFTIVVFSASTVLAVIMVELLIGLFPVTTMWMWNQFRGPIALAIGAFMLQFGALYPYYHYWEAIRRRNVALHLLLGAAAAVLMLVWVSVLDGMGSYMLTPVTDGSTWANLWNPTWSALVLHRLVGELMMAGYVIAAYGAWRFGRPRDNAHREYYVLLFNTGWMVGLAALLLQPFTGLLYAFSIRQAVPAAYEQIVRGPYQFLAYTQFTLVGLLIVGNHFLLHGARASGERSRWLDIAIPLTALWMIASVGHTGFRRALLYLLVALTLWSVFKGQQSYTTLSYGQEVGQWGRSIAITLGVLSVLIYLTMGIIRETARRPDTVRNMISLHDEAAHPAAFRESGQGKTIEPHLRTEKRE
ncbi:MAG TPA: cytochrome ubiquinol oxidase subunit I [Nitrospira sp.]